MQVVACAKFVEGMHSGAIQGQIKLDQVRNLGQYIHFSLKTRLMHQNEKKRRRILKLKSISISYTRYAVYIKLENRNTNATRAIMNLRHASNRLTRKVPVRL